MHSTNLLWFTIKFFFSQELSQWIPLGVKGQIRNLFEIFSFDDAILEIIGFEAELHHQKIFSPKTLQICKDTYHFDNNHESNLKPYWNREMIKECVNIIAIKTFINLVFSSKEFHFFYRRTTRKTFFIRSCIQGRLLIAYVKTTPTLRKYSLISDLVIFISKRCL